MIAMFFVAVSFYFLSTNVKAQAPTTAALDGYAWSSNIGWISFATSTNGNNLATIDSSGNISGFAWSPNIGWVKFGGLSSFPTGGGTVASNAIYDNTTKLITGWARACAGTISGNCTSMTSRSDGWDGWISLFGTGYGVNLNSSPSYAWGGDVVGWVDFGGVSVKGSNGVNGQCGASQGQTSTSTPDSNLCSVGSALSVGESSDFRTYIWSCSGTNGGSSVACYVNRICDGGKIISRIDGSCVTATCGNGVSCSSGYACVNNQCLDTSTNCIQDGVVLQAGSSADFYSSRISKICDSLGQNRTCQPGGSLDGDVSYKYRKCVSPGYKEF